MKKDRIKNIFFDVGGVLVLKEDIDWAALGEKYGLKAGTAKDIFIDCYHQKTTGEDFDLKIYFDQNYSDLLSWPEFKKMRTQVFQREALNKELLEWIKNHKESYIMGIATNNTVALKSLLEDKFEIRPLFEHIFNSAKIGYTKPDRRFFEYVLKNIDAGAQKCLFVDNKKENVKTARDFGFHTILFKSNEDFFSKEQITKN